jgi:DNA-binding response OmpR family regulator
VRVLLIDDDSRLAKLLADWFGPQGVVLHHAPDGLRGLEVVARGGVDVVLLDVMMPGVDGLEVLRRLRATSSACP